jgi:hypothetical protein
MSFRTDLTINIGGVADTKALDALQKELVELGCLGAEAGAPAELTVAALVEACGELCAPGWRVSHWEGCLSIDAEDVRPWYFDDLANICSKHGLSYDIVYASTEEGPGALESWRPGMELERWVFLDIDGEPQIDRDEVEQALAMLTGPAPFIDAGEPAELLRQALNKIDALPILEIVRDVS